MRMLDVPVRVSANIQPGVEWRFLPSVLRLAIFSRSSSRFLCCCLPLFRLGNPHGFQTNCTASAVTGTLRSSFLVVCSMLLQVAFAFVALVQTSSRFCSTLHSSSTTKSSRANNLFDTKLDQSLVM
jgi:cytochrome c oxidase assembly protein Cox11